MLKHPGPLQLPPGAGAPVEGWKSAVDPTDLKGKPRLDLKLTVPIKHGNRSVASLRPSNFIALYDDAFGTRTWGLLNLATGAYTPAFTAKMRMSEIMLSPDGQYIAGKVGEEGPEPASLEVWTTKSGKVLHRLSSGDNTWPPLPLGFAAGDQLLSITNTNFKPHMQAWDLKTGNKTWEIPLAKMFEPKNTAISPGGKFLAVIFEDKLLSTKPPKAKS